MFLEKATHPLDRPHPISPSISPKSQVMTTTHESSMPVPSTQGPGPLPTFTSSPSQYSLFSGNTTQQQVSPPTTTNSSPTSPRTAHTQQQQLRKPKNPLYVPAVLRPTDPPKRATRSTGGLVTPPRSQEGSFDDLVGQAGVGRRDSLGAKMLLLGSIEEAEWSNNVSSRGLPKVTGIPTRDHWKPDSHSIHCDYTPPPLTSTTSPPTLSSSPHTSFSSSPSTCTREFGYFYRRHHCRRCGQIFCHNHSSLLIPLDQDANYHPRGTRVRACETCYLEYGAWARARSRRGSEMTSEGGEEVFEEPPTPTVSCRLGKSGLLGGEDKKGEQAMGQSVPRDWNWSTF